MGSPVCRTVSWLELAVRGITREDLSTAGARSNALSVTSRAANTQLRAAGNFRMIRCDAPGGDSL